MKHKQSNVTSKIAMLYIAICSIYFLSMVIFNMTIFTTFMSSILVFASIFYGTIILIKIIKFIDNAYKQKFEIHFAVQIEHIIATVFWIAALLFSTININHFFVSVLEWSITVIYPIQVTLIVFSALSFLLTFTIVFMVIFSKNFVIVLNGIFINYLISYSHKQFFTIFNFNLDLFKTSFIALFLNKVFARILKTNMMTSLVVNTIESDSLKETKKQMTPPQI